METTYLILRIIHITAGMTAFFVAPVALIVKKGGPAHIRWGRVFFWAMVTVALSALVMTTIKTNIFLLLVAVFSFHLSLIGYRAAARRKAQDQEASRKVDLILAVVMILFYLGLAAWGSHLFSLKSHHAFGYISLAFSLIGLRFSFMEIRAFRNPSPDRMAWWYRHMNGMVGSYIAAVSAFSAVNLGFLPEAIRWLWPTVIGAPLLALWVRYYKRRWQRQ